MRRSKPLFAIATGVALFSLAACGGSGSDDGDTPTNDRTFKGTEETIAKDAERQGPAPEVDGAATGGTITVYLPSDPGPTDLDPTGGWSVTGNSIQQALVNRSLTQYARDNESGEMILVPDLAEDLGTPNDDFTEWTFTIRDDATWETGDRSPRKRSPSALPARWTPSSSRPAPVRSTRRTSSRARTSTPAPTPTRARSGTASRSTTTPAP
jgi:peptide/nickel transport system substrate-binding protein